MEDGGGSGVGIKAAARRKVRVGSGTAPEVGYGTIVEAEPGEVSEVGAGKLDQEQHQE